jgi:alpha-D-xyloside xylohydrolase
MAESLRGGLSLCASGFGFWSHDILMPTLYGAAVEAHETGMPVMRAMPIEFPGDPACDTLDRQYMLGERLLVAPVFAPDGTVDYYLPAGRWTNFLSGETVEGGRWVREQHGYLSLPLMVRSNTVLAVGANENRPDYEYVDGVVYHVFALEDGVTATAQVPALDGSVETTVEACRRGAQIEIAVQGATPTGGRQPWSILLRGIENVASVTDGTAQSDGLGTRLIPAEGVRRLVVHL